MNFSRRKAMQPLPPAPLDAYTLATSRNLMAASSRGPFSQEIGRRQQHLMTKHLGGPGTAFAHGRAVVPGAKLGQNMAGHRIIVEPAGANFSEAQSLEGKSHNAMGRLGGKALTPEGLAQPVAELEAWPVLMQADAAHEHAILFAKDGEDVAPTLAARFDAGHEIFGILFAVWVGYAAHVLRHAIVAQPHNHPRDIAGPGRAQNQSFSLQSTHVIPRNPFVSRGTKKGDGGPSPSLPDEPPISWRPFWGAAYSAAIFMAGFAAGTTDTKVRRL